MPDRDVLLATRIAAAYPSWSISTMTIADWTERLRELEPDVAVRVVDRLRNLPSPPDPWDWRLARSAERSVEYVHALPAPERTPEEIRRLEDCAREVFAALREKWRASGRPAASSDVPFLRQIPPAPSARQIEERRRDQLARLRAAAPEEFETTGGVPFDTTEESFVHRAQEVHVHHDEIRNILSEVFTPELAQTGVEKLSELGVNTTGLGYGQAPEVIRDFAGWLFERLEENGYAVAITPTGDAQSAAV